jgi:flagellar M-ring protein FliF
MAAIDMDRLRAHGRRFAEGFTTGQKTITVLGVVAVVLAAYFFMGWASQPDWTVLYSDLDGAAAADVTTELDAQGVAYKLTDGGRTVLVPRGEVYATRVSLSAKGLPESSGEGWSLLDGGGITKDEFSKRVDYQRALQGELGRTIQAIRGVRAASVTLTIPPERVFVGAEETQPKASVLVDTSTRLNAETTQAIVHLVASSVPGLEPGAVTVSDADGNILHAPGQDGRMASGQQTEQQVAFESSLAAKIEGLVTSALGPGRAAVTVQADLDFSTTERRTTEFQQPGDIRVPTTERTLTETYTGPGDGSTGILGPDGTPIAGGDSTPVDYSRTETESQMALNTIEETINEAPGGIERLSVSVLLDAEAVDSGSLAQWQNTISAAAGIDAERGDQLQVTRVEFDEEAREAAAAQLQAAASGQSQTQLLDIVRAVVTLLIVGLVLFLAWRAIKRSEANRVPLRVPLDLRELEAADLAAAVPETPRLPDARLPLEAVPGVEAEVTTMIERQPDEVAQTLRSWLADRRS